MGLAYFFRDRLIFHPVKGLEMTIKDTGWDFEEVWLTGLRGERVNAWYAPGPPGRYTALLLHGNGGNLTDMVGRILSYHRLQLGVMAIDYQGFGLSEGRPSLESAVQNAVAAWDFLVEKKKIPPEKIVVHGFSLGGGVAGQLVSLRPTPHPLVLDSTFTSLEEAAQAILPTPGLVTRVLLGSAYDTRAALRNYKATMAIFLHSPEDKVVRYKLGRALYDSYQNGPKMWVDLYGGHMDYIDNQGLYEKALAKGLELTFAPIPAKRETANSDQAASNEVGGASPTQAD
jgi:pimeloyl-ACP methyl ester carboxylesterase